MKNNTLRGIYRLYYEGFRDMRLGKTLWTVILIKLFIIFVVLKLFFFPDHLKQHAVGGDRATYVCSQLEGRAADTP